MDIKWTSKIESWQKSNPVMYHRLVKLPESVDYPGDKTLESMFKMFRAKRLKTWQRGKDKTGRVMYANDPHYIATHGGTPLHHDWNPKGKTTYPRYSHHLKVRCDSGHVVRGIDCEELVLCRGMYYILDSHSPHEVYDPTGEGWNVSISMDADEILLPHDDTIITLVKYAMKSDITEK